MIIEIEDRIFERKKFASFCPIIFLVDSHSRERERIFLCRKTSNLNCGILKLSAIDFCIMVIEIEIGSLREERKKLSKENVCFSSNFFFYGNRKNFLIENWFEQAVRSRMNRLTLRHYRHPRARSIYERDCCKLLLRRRIFCIQRRKKCIEKCRTMASNRVFFFEHHRCLY